MNPAVSLRMIAESPVAFLGPKSPWRRAPVFLTRGRSSVDLCAATTVTEAAGYGRDDALGATLAFLLKSGFLNPDTLAISLSVPDRRRTDPVTVGRDSLNDVVIDHSTISRAHARLCPPSMSGLRWTVTDVGSSNGTHVGGLPIKTGEPRELDDMIDMVTFGELCLLFVEQDLFELYVCEAVSQPWAAELPDTKKVTELTSWKKLAGGEEQTEPLPKPAR